MHISQLPDDSTEVNINITIIDLDVYLNMFIVTLKYDQ